MCTKNGPKDDENTQNGRTKCGSQNGSLTPILGVVRKNRVFRFFFQKIVFFLFFDFVFVRCIFVMKSNEYTMVTTSLGSLPLRPSASFFCSPTTFFSQFSRFFFTFLGVRIPVGWLWSFVIGPYPQLLWPPFLPPHFRKYFSRFLSFFNGFV